MLFNKQMIVVMAADCGSVVSELVLLLQPHLLNDSTLVNILKDRCVRRPGLSSLQRNQLLTLFYSVAVPLPQRKYRDNRRGRILTKVRERLERLRRIEDCSLSSTVKIGFPEGSSPCHVVAGTVDRLKPPPCNIGLEQKKIGLSGNSLDSESKRLKMVHLSHTNGDSLDEVIVKEKVVVKPTSSSEQVEAPRKIKLKRSFSNTSAVISSCQVSSTSVETEKDPSEKKIRKKIMWP